MRQQGLERGEMIRQLVEHSINTAIAEPQRHWLQEIFGKGFAGYGKMSDRQLLLELQLRNLAPAEEIIDENIDFDDDGEDSDPVSDQMFQCIPSLSTRSTGRRG